LAIALKRETEVTVLYVQERREKRLFARSGKGPRASSRSMIKFFGKKKRTRKFSVKKRKKSGGNETFPGNTLPEERKKTRWSFSARKKGGEVRPVKKDAV